MNAIKIPRSFGTHDRTFHADEVTACAFLLLFDLIDEDKIYRTRDPEVLSACAYMCDVGGLYDPERHLFDHHQAGYQGLLSSAGMILLHLKDTGVMTPAVYDFFNDSLVLGVDAHDNGRFLKIPGWCSYSLVIANFAPFSHDPPNDEQERAFYEALHFALGHLRRLWGRYQYVQSCRGIVEEAMKKQEVCLMFDRGISWVDVFFELDGKSHPAQFVIMPSGHQWTLRGIPPSLEERMSVRCPLPLEWAGLLEGDLKQVSGIPGAVFCHKGRFISVWKTKEDAITALEFTLKKGMT